MLNMPANYAIGEVAGMPTDSIYARLYSNSEWKWLATETLTFRSVRKAPSR